MSGFATVAGFVFAFIVLVTIVSFSLFSVFDEVEQRAELIQSRGDFILSGQESLNLLFANYDALRLRVIFENSELTSLRFRQNGQVCIDVFVNGRYISKNNFQIFTLSTQRVYSILEPGQSGVLDILLPELDISQEIRVEVVLCNGNREILIISPDEFNVLNESFSFRSFVDIENSLPNSIDNELVSLPLDSSDLNFSLTSPTNLNFFLPFTQNRVLYLTFDNSTSDLFINLIPADSSLYCSVVGGNTVDNDIITGVSLNGLTLSKGDSGGYLDATNLITNPMIPGEQYELQVSFNTFDGFNSCIFAWFDWDQEGSFDNADYYQVGCGSSTTVSTLITVPLSASPGTTMFRITQDDSGNTITNACVNPNWGEIVDLTAAVDVVSSGQVPDSTDYSRFSQNVFLGNNPANTDFNPSLSQGLFFSSLRFTGDEFITIQQDNSLVLQEQLTFSLWVNPSQQVTSNQYLFQNGNFRNSLSLTEIDGENFVLFTLLGSLVQGSLTSSDPIPIDAWTHIVGTYDGSVMRLYLNGELSSQQLLLGPIEGSLESNFIGSRFGTSNFFIGLLDEIQVFDISLTSDEVNKLYRNKLFYRILPYTPTSWDALAGEGTVDILIPFIRGGSQITLELYY